MNKPDNDKQGTESRATAAMQRFLGAVADKALPEEITIAQISGWLGRNYKTLRSDDFARIGVRAGKLVPIQSAGGVAVKYRVNLDNFEKFQRAVRLFCARPDNLQLVSTKMYTTSGAEAKNLYGFDYLLLSVDEAVGTDVTLTDDERWHVIDLLKKQGFMEEVQVGKLPYYRLTRKSFRGMHFSDVVDLIKLMDGEFLPLPKAANGASVSTPSAPAASLPRRPEPTESRRQRRRNERTAAAPNGAVAVESKATVAPTVQASEEARKEVEEVREETPAATMAAAEPEQEASVEDEAVEVVDKSPPAAGDETGMVLYESGGGSTATFYISGDESSGARRRRSEPIVNEVGAAATAHEVPEATTAEEEVRVQHEPSLVPSPTTEARGDQVLEASDASGESVEFVAAAEQAGVEAAESPDAYLADGADWFTLPGTARDEGQPMPSAEPAGEATPVQEAPIKPSRVRLTLKCPSALSEFHWERFKDLHGTMNGEAFDERDVKASDMGYDANVGKAVAKSVLAEFRKAGLLHRPIAGNKERHEFGPGPEKGKKK